MKLFGTSLALRNLLWMRNVSGSLTPFGRSLSKLRGDELTWRETHFEVSSEVRSAVAEHGPVVALESAIITHGMPFPNNIETALGVQTIIRQKGVVPATVGVIEGKVKVGLSDDEIEFLGSKAPTRHSSPVKVSRRDFPFVMAKRLSGGTTVAGTVIACAKAGIPLFATGGVGGVHRGAEMTFDISCDLREVGRHPVGVVCAGVKSILDIGKTLEYLETEGVSVCVLRKECPSEGVTGESGVKFPSFLSAESEWDSPWTVEDESEAASLLHSAITFNLGSGLIIAVPIPKEEEVSGEVIEGAIGAALEEAKMNGVSGKAMTPFLLARINAATAGESLRANGALMENNGAVAATIAIQLSKLQRKFGRSDCGRDVRHAQTEDGDERNRVTTTVAQPTPLSMSPLPPGRPVIIGGSSLDIVMAVQEQLHTDGRTHSGSIGTAPGGVGRNVAEALRKLGHDPLLITAIAQDPFGNYLLQNMKSTKMDTAGIHFCPNANTAVYSAILSRDGECIYGIGDMVIHDQIQPNLILSHSDDIKSAAIVVMDANIPPNTMATIMRLCSEHNVPLWFEPTEVRKARRLLEVPRELWPSISFMSPNLKEVQSLLQPSPKSSAVRDVETIVSESFAQFTGLSLILLTRGKEGFMVAQRHSAPPKEQRSVASFPRPSISSHEVKSVSGAGDCLDAGFISGLLRQMTLQDCALTATQCAADSLRSIYAVPLNFTTPKRLSLTN